MFEVVRAFREVDQSWERLRTAFGWISEMQLRAALAYAEAYPDEIEQRLRDEDRWNREAIWTRYPFMRPQTPSAG